MTMLSDATFSPGMCNYQQSTSAILTGRSDKRLNKLDSQIYTNTRHAVEELLIARYTRKAFDVKG